MMRALFKPRPALRILERHIIDRRHIANLRNKLAEVNTKRKPKPPLDADVESRLRGLYAEDVDLLEKLVGLDFSGWKPGNANGAKRSSGGLA